MKTTTILFNGEHYSMSHMLFYADCAVYVSSLEEDVIIMPNSHWKYVENEVIVDKRTREQVINDLHKAFGIKT